MTTSPGSLVVVGGGLAGLAAAIEAADAGWQVRLLEARPRLGGATASFTRTLDGETLTIDTGQHVFLRCCTAYRAFLRRLGVEAHTSLQPRLDVPVVDLATGRSSRLRRDPLPAPLHLARALAGYRLLSPVERARAIRAALLLGRVDRAAAASDARTFADWLTEHGQGPAAIARLFDVYTVATLNAPAAQVSLGLAATVFQDGLLRARDAADIGLPQLPLGELHGAAAARVLAGLGAEVALHTRVRAITPHPDGHFAVHTDQTEHQMITADAVVLAVPPDGAAALLPPQAADTSAPAGLGASPILNVHVVYDRRVMYEPFLATVGSPAQFVFDRSRPSGLAGAGQYLAISVSAADRFIDTPVEQLRTLFVAELERLLPASRRARVRDFFVTRERAATFRGVPGSAARRLATRTALPNLLLAGAWTDTGWPATMEGAVRSGVAAASALLPVLSEPGTGEAGPRRSPPGNEIDQHDVDTAEEALA